MTPEAEKEMEHAIEQALRGGNPEDAVRAIMTHRHCSLDAARAELHQRLKARAKR